MSQRDGSESRSGKMGFFARYPTLWVFLGILGGILLGRAAPGVARSLDSLSLYVNEAPVVSVLVAVCLFFIWTGRGSTWPACGRGSCAGGTRTGGCPRR